jgi:5'-nucleotidase
MSVDFSDTLVVGISSRALFDLEEENKIFMEQGVEAYREFQTQNETKALEKGTAFYLVEALLALNKQSEQQLVEVIVMSKNSPETGLRVLHSIEHYGLPITRSAFAGGEPLANFMEAFCVDLFLSKDDKDVQSIIDQGFAASALIYDPPKEFNPEQNTVRIAFDADAVLFSDESEQIYKKDGLEAFLQNEKENTHIPLKEGPYSKLLKTLSTIQHKMGKGLNQAPLKIAIVTARSSPSHFRVIQTLREWQVNVDSIFFLGGMAKHKVLKAFNAHIFFDDQEVHLKDTSMHIPAGKVPYKSDSPLHPINKH